MGVWFGEWLGLGLAHHCLHAARLDHNSVQSAACRRLSRREVTQYLVKVRVRMTGCG